MNLIGKILKRSTPNHTKTLPKKLTGTIEFDDFLLAFKN
jgi:hypothetical protein